MKHVYFTILVFTAVAACAPSQTAPASSPPNSPIKTVYCSSGPTNTALPTNSLNDTGGRRRIVSAPYPTNVDVCKYSTPVPMGPPGKDGMIDVPPAHPYILYFGRIDCSDPNAPGFAFPGVSISARFTGTKLDMKLKDHAKKKGAMGNGTVGNPEHSSNYYNIIIDEGVPLRIQVFTDKTTYELARDLSPGEHTVEIFKRTESGYQGNINVGKGEFLGLRIEHDAQILPLGDRPNRIEFIGDSITCGYGNELATHEPDKFHHTTKNSNGYNAWGAIAARKLDAEYMAVAYSGRGISRNWESEPLETLPQLYLKSLPEDPAASPWSTEQFRPQVIVINLGSNDWSEGMGLQDIPSMRQKFVSAYTAFLETLRNYYPDATIILALGPMMSDYYPKGYSAWTNIQADISTIIKARHGAGDRNVHTIVFPLQTAPYGEDWHPTVETHRQMAEKLVIFINKLGVMNPKEP